MVAPGTYVNWAAAPLQVNPHCTDKTGRCVTCRLPRQLRVAKEHLRVLQYRQLLSDHDQPDSVHLDITTFLLDSIAVLYSNFYCIIIVLLLAECNSVNPDMSSVRYSLFNKGGGLREGSDSDLKNLLCSFYHPCASGVIATSHDCSKKIESDVMKWWCCKWLCSNDVINVTVLLNKALMNEWMKCVCIWDLKKNQGRQPNWKWNC